MISQLYCKFEPIIGFREGFAFMSSGKSFIHSILALVLLFGTTSCVGGANQSAMNDVGPGAGDTQAVPGMEEVAIGPGVDVNTDVVQLTCSGGNDATVSRVDGEGDAAPELQAANPVDQVKEVSFQLKMSVLAPQPHRVIRVIDKVKSEFRQPLLGSDSKATLSLRPQATTDFEFYMTSLSAMEASSEAQSCPNGECKETGMTKLSVCLPDDSCRAYGFTQAACLKLPGDKVSPGLAPIEN